MKLRVILAGAVAAMLALPAAAALPTKVYVFGDSFTDSGNANIGTGGAAANAAQGYFQGRFGDGYNFADFISKRLTGEYATPFLAGGDNFSVGGARAGGDSMSGPFVVPGLPSQRTFYASKYGNFVDPNGLYIINFGNNDVNAIQSGDIGGLTVPQYSAAYVTNIVQTIGLLNAGGATRIVILGVPNPDEVEGQALQAQLDAALDLIEPSLTADLTRFDFFAFFNALRASPQSYGLTADVDFTTPCLAARPVINGSVDCTGFFSFDGIHVTEPVQFEIARAVLTQAGLPTVPEPGTWALMIIGFGMTGLAVRRRTAQPA
ncbi:SGNH/GDSL hydrolase family protein [Glacieibacterium frigidum]|uniref:PEP-CTERM sorting domain-containing protein n=1 Tax=Glacieibacterium frigidum TaxID=2593303 RepID=A0A552UJJ4_9SPHN|nr:SGNH/GDSL hydrolase family protein [Glacieibacterium frigidum]TRW18408.1 PEP-CTERM sorting domain-containing protein [Glacieibacterium frigidum]